MNEFQQSKPIPDVMRKDLNANKQASIDVINQRIDEQGKNEYYFRCWTECDEAIGAQIYGLVQETYPGDEFARALTPGSEPHALAVGMASGYQYGCTAIAKQDQDVAAFREQLWASIVALRKAGAGDTQFLRSRVLGVDNENRTSAVDDVNVSDNLVFWIGFGFVRDIADSVLLANVFGDAQPYDSKAQKAMRKLIKKIVKMDDEALLKHMRD